MLLKKVAQVSFLSLTLTLTSCSKGGMFGGKFGQIFGGGSGGGVSSSTELEAFKYTAGFGATYSDLLDKLNDQDAKICGSLDSILTLIPSGDPDSAGLRDALLEIMTEFNFTEGGCATLAEETEESFKAALKIKLGLSGFSGSVEGNIGATVKERMEKLASEYAAKEGGLTEDDITLISASLEDIDFTNKNLLLQNDNFLKYLLVMDLLERGDLNLSGSLIEQLDLKSKNQDEMKSYVQIELKLDPKYTDKIQISQAEIEKTLKLKVRREALQIITNALMARGVNIFSVLTFLGVRVVDSSDGVKKADTSVKNIIGLLGLDKNSLDELFVDEKNKAISSSKLMELFRGNKPHLYHVIESAFDENQIEKISEATFKHHVSVSKLCGHITKVIPDQDTSACSTELNMFLGNLVFIQDIEKRKIDIIFERKTGFEEFAQDLNFLEIQYDFNYKFEIQFHLEGLKTYLATILEKQFKDTTKAEFNASNKLDQKDIDFIKQATLKGTVGLSDYIEIPEEFKAREDAQSKGFLSLADVTKTTLKSNLGVSFNKPIELLIPQKTDETMYYDAFFQNSGSDPSKIEGDKDGDIKFSSAKADNIFGIMHRRYAADDQKDYDDTAFIKLAKTDFYFPPYLLTTNDFLNFDGVVNQGCSDQKAANGECQYQLRLRKNLADITKNESVTIRDFVNPSHYIDTTLTTNNLGVRFLFPANSNASSEDTSNRKVAGDLYHQKAYVKLATTLEDSRFMGEYLDPSHPEYRAPNPNGSSPSSYVSNYAQFQQGSFEVLMRSKEGLIEDEYITRPLSASDFNVSTNVSMRRHPSAEHPEGELFEAKYCNVGIFSSLGYSTAPSSSYFKYHGDPYLTFLKDLPNYDFSGATPCSNLP